MRFRRGLRTRLSRSLVVHTVHGSSIRGVLIGEYSDLIVLTAASLLRGTEPAAPVAGDAVIFRDQIDFIQDVTGVEQRSQTLPGPPS